MSTSPFPPLDDETKASLKRYWDGVRPLFEAGTMQHNAMVRVDERTFMWCVVQDLSPEAIRHLQDSWNHLVPDIRLIVVSKTVWVLAFEQLEAIAEQQIAEQDPPVEVPPEIAGDNVVEMVKSVRKTRTKKE